MKNNIICILLFICFSFFPETIYAQSHATLPSKILDSLSITHPGLNQEVNLSVNKASIQEILRTVSISNELNIVVDPGIQENITYNFNHIPAKDIFLFLCSKYKLEISYSNSIFHIKKEESKPYIKTNINLVVDSLGLISADLKHDSLGLTIKKLVELTGSNILLSPELQNKTINLFAKRQNLTAFLNSLAFSNDFEINNNDGIFLLKTYSVQAFTNSNNVNSLKKTRGNISSNASNISVKNINDITIIGENIPIAELILEVFKKLETNYFIADGLEGNTDLSIKHVGLTTFLDNVFLGTKYSYSLQNNIYVIGDRSSESVRSIKIVAFKNRSITGVLELVPETLKKDILTKEFTEQNSIILSGSERQVESVVKLLQMTDKLVPVVMIEVMVINNESGYAISTGIQAGIGDKPVASGGTILSGIDYTINGDALTKLLNSFNGFGSANLGKVNPNFYLTIKALEEQGYVEVKSTPLLTTLNGHEAKMKLGNTQYYIEETSDYIINQSTQQRTLKQYKAVNADFSLTITPVVSTDEQITLDIKVEQSDFTERIEKGAPPGQVSRSFTSIIRVRNEEMILLGGLESKTSKETGSGIPLLSRIPVIKWLFSSRTKEKKSTKLNLFIKPTVIY